MQSYRERNFKFHGRLSRLIALLLIATLGVPTISTAGPGHDHGEHSATPVAGSTQPRVTAVSESFELVGILLASELSILIDRAPTNEPVVDAKLTVDVDGRSVVAAFHKDHGDYSLTDAEMLKKLRTPGVKSLTFTLITGKDADLLSGELDVHDDAHANKAGTAHAWKNYAIWAGAGGGILVLLVFLARRLSARKQRVRGAL